MYEIQFTQIKVSVLGVLFPCRRTWNHTGDCL